MATHGAVKDGQLLALPSGTVTLLFTDIEGSTRLLHELGERYAKALSDHRRILRGACRAHGGVEVDTQGDAFFIAFAHARDAVLAAAEGQRALARHAWPAGAVLRVRMGIHSGEPILYEEGYVGMDVHRAARICSVAHGEQVVLSERTVELARGADAEPPVQDLGLHRLKDLAEPERLFQLLGDGLRTRFPPVRVAKELPAAAGLPDYGLPPADIPCPYKGLLSFEAHDRELFFGREALVESVGARLERASLLAVVGPSGSGKSSLVRAGVVPGFERRGAPAERRESVLLTPGEHPLEALAGPLAAVCGVSPAAAADALHHGPEATANLVRGRRGGQALVVVDQFEEAFTLCADEDERRAFVEGLVAAAQRDAGVRVVICLRADFYGHCALHPSLAAAAEEHHALVGPMSEPELRSAIEGPAHHVGLSLEPGLVETILRDVEGEPGALPLLSHCLVETWGRRSGRLLTLVGYLQSGGAHGAIAQTAETVFREELSPRERRLARTIFLRLAEPGRTSEDTRRRATPDELVHRREQAAAVGRIVDVLVHARLLTTDQGTVEVAHEALIRHWPTLRAWLDEDREGRRIRHALAEAAHEWRALGREDGALYRGSRLAGASEWAEAHEDDVNELEREFLDASRKAAREELEAARRKNRRLRALAAALAALVVAAGVLAGFATRETRRAERQAQVASSRGLAARAVAALDRRLDDALRLGLAAFSSGQTLEGRTSLLAGIQATRAMEAILSGRQDVVADVVVGRDGTWIASGGSDGTVVVWDVRTRRALTTLRTEDGSAVTSLAAAPDGVLLAAGTDRGGVVVFDRRLRVSVLALDGHVGAVGDLGFSDDGRQLTTSSSFDSTVRRWDVRTGRPIGAARRVRSGAEANIAVAAAGTAVAIAGGDDGVEVVTPEAGGTTRLARSGSEVTAIALDRAGETLAVGTRRGSVRVWDVSARRPAGPALRLAREPVTALALSPDGTRVAGGSADGTVRTWRVGTSDPAGGSRNGHAEQVASLAFAIDGRTVASGGDDGTIVVWPTEGGTPLDRALRRSADMSDAAVSPSGEVLALGGLDGSVALRRLPGGEPLGAPLPGAGGGVTVAISRGGRLVATADQRGAVVIWDLVRRRRVLGPLRAFSEGFVDVAFSPDGRLVAAAGKDGTLTLWELPRGRRLGAPLPGHSGSAGRSSFVSEILFTPDSGTLISAGADGSIRLWDVARRRLDSRPLRGHGGPVTGIALDARGTTLASASLDGTVRLWGIPTGRALGGPLEAEGGPQFDVAITSDGTTLAAAGERNLTFWDVPSRRVLGRPLGFEGEPSWSVAFGSGDRELVALGDEGVRRLGAPLWTARPQVLRQRVCALARAGCGR